MTRRKRTRFLVKAAVAAALLMLGLLLLFSRVYVKSDPDASWTPEGEPAPVWRETEVNNKTVYIPYVPAPPTLPSPHITPQPITTLTLSGDAVLLVDAWTIIGFIALATAIATLTRK